MTCAHVPAPPLPALLKSMDRIHMSCVGPGQHARAQKPKPLARSLGVVLSVYLLAMMGSTSALVAANTSSGPGVASTLNTLSCLA